MAIDLAAVANTSGSYPTVVSVNSTGPGNYDGTPFIKQWLDDLFGWMQAILDHGNYSAPSGTADVAGTSERITALQRIAGHPGEVVAWVGNNDAPATSPEYARLLPLNGQAVTIADYQDLVDACYVGDALNSSASAFYKTSDAGGTTRSTSGAYFVLADMRGYVPRGLDTSGTVDPDGASRDIGSVQEDAYEEHAHRVRQRDNSNYIWNLTTAKDGNESLAQIFYFNSSIASNALIARGNETSVVSSTSDPDETRGANVAVRWMVRY